jgi:CheY-like chemotaxis protein
MNGPVNLSVVAGPARSKPDGTILLVEDNPDIRESLALVLEGEGYDVATAGDGVEALEYLEAEAAPCLMLLDLMMPRLDGFGVLAALRSGSGPTEPLPVVVISAAGPSTLRVPEGAAAAMLAKPLDIDALIETVSRCCRRMPDDRAA